MQVHVSSGVPQGTVHGPLLFLFYIKDIPIQISQRKPSKCSLMLYWKINNHTDQDNLQHDLVRLIDWEQNWQMAFNSSKCEIMHITRSKLSLDNSYRIHGAALRAEPVATHCGIDIMKQPLLEPTHQQEKLKSIPQSTKGYQSMVCPHIKFCWNHSGTSTL